MQFSQIKQKDIILWKKPEETMELCSCIPPALKVGPCKTELLQWARCVRASSENDKAACDELGKSMFKCAAEKMKKEDFLPQ